MKYAEGRLKFLSKQRDERNNLENELDSQHTEELTKLRSEISVQTENELRGVSDNLKLKLPTDGEMFLIPFSVLHDTIDSIKFESYLRRIQ